MRRIILINVIFWLALLVLFSTSGLPGKSNFWVSLHNAGHGLAMCVAAFIGILTIALKSPQHTFKVYVIVPIALLALSIMIEVVQYAIGRGASLGDLVMDTAGIVAGTSLSTLVCIRKKPLLKSLFCLVGAVALLYCVRLPAYYLAAELLAPDLPILANFDNFAARGSVRSTRTHISVKDHQDVWPQSTANSMSVIYSPARWPNAKILRPPIDWSAYNSISVDIFNAEDVPVKFNMRIDYRSTTPKRAFMIGRELLPPGHTSVEFSFEELSEEYRGNEPDFENILSVMLYLSSPETKTTLYFDNLVLNQM